MTVTHSVAKWTFKQESVIQLHIAGMKNIDIADAVGYTPVRVSQLINSDQGKAAIQVAKDQLRQKMEEDIHAHIAVAAEYSAKRVLETLKTKFVPGSDPKHHQDKVALKVLSGSGFLPGNAKSQGESSGSKLTTSLVSRLTTALEASNTAKEIHADAVDAEYEVVEEENVAGG